MEFIDVCLRSVIESSYPDFEVIVVDNASTDGSSEYIKRVFGTDPRLRLIENPGSFGPAIGRNQGAELAKGKYLIFLDNDTKVDKACFGELVAVLEGDATVGAAQAKLLQWDNPGFYDCAGDYLGPLGFLIERSKRQKDSGQFNRIEDIFSAKSAGSVIRKDIFEQIKGFDGDFYMYLEETDLSWRVWLRGYRVVFIPQAVVYHAFGGAKKKSRAKDYYPKYVVRYYGCRNYILTLCKNLSVGNLFKMLPLHIFAWMAIAFLFALKGKLIDCFYIAKAIGWNIINLPRVAVKRNFVQKSVRTIPDSFIMQRVLSRETASDYLKKTFIYTGT